MMSTAKFTLQLLYCLKLYYEFSLRGITTKKFPPGERKMDTDPVMSESSKKLTTAKRKEKGVDG